MGGGHHPRRAAQGVVVCGLLLGCLLFVFTDAHVVQPTRQQAQASPAELPRRAAAGARTLLAEDEPGSSVGDAGAAARTDLPTRQGKHSSPARRLQGVRPPAPGHLPPPPPPTRPVHPPGPAPLPPSTPTPSEPTPSPPPPSRPAGGVHEASPAGRPPKEPRPGYAVEEPHEASIFEGCVPVECAHDEVDCEPVSCTFNPKACYPVACDEPDSPGCATLSLPGYNASHFMCGEPPCEPVECAHDDHECEPVYCDGEDHTVDPCNPGEHGEDGLAFWPFLLLALLLAILGTSVLQALGNGACCGKSLNLPFTVVVRCVPNPSHATRPPAQWQMANNIIAHDAGAGAGLRCSSPAT